MNRLFVILFPAALAWMAVSTLNAEPSEADPIGADYNIRLLTENAPDLTNIDRYLKSITGQYANPQDQAIAIWRWSQRMRKQMTNPIEGGQNVLDPVRIFNSFGFCNCGIISGVNDALWLRMGWKAHYVQLGDHTVTECSWDAGKTWHMFDSSMSFYCFNDHGEVASVREIEKNPRFYLTNFAPECGTNPVRDINDQQGWRCASDRPVEFQRTLANGYDSFKPPNEIGDTNLLAQWGSEYVLNLRPNEAYTRFFRQTGGEGARTFRPVAGGKDVDINKNIRSNGVWRYAPDLKAPSTRQMIYLDSGVSWTSDGVKGPGWVIFKISAANVVTSASVTLSGSNLELSVSRDPGINWEKIEVKSGKAEILGQIAGETEYLLKADLGANGLLDSIDVETITQLNRAALPKLVRGPNRIQVGMGPQLETIRFQPSVVAGNYKKTVFSEKSLDSEQEAAFYKPILRPAENRTPCYATWKVETPTPISDVIFGGTVCVRSPNDRVTLLHSWDDREYVRDYEKNDTSSPYDLMVNSAVSSVPAGVRTAYLRYEFETAGNAKSYTGPGIQMAAMTIHHQPRVAKFVPLEVTYCWIEHREDGDLERTHRELVNSPSQEYTINVSGFRDPTMKWVRMNLQRFGSDGKYGYVDGHEIGKVSMPPWERYTWGKNLAAGKAYTVEGRQDERNPDAGLDLTDGIIAPPDTYVSSKYMPTNVMFSKDVSPIVTIDLGRMENISAIRIHASQEGGFHLTYPEQISVGTSTDGQDYAPAGVAPFRQVFDPPADYVPWELDDAAQFEDLPAGGRLAYAYRIILDQPKAARYVRVKCTARKGWGVLLSEIQVFDTVKVDKTVPCRVLLPPLLPK